MFIKSIRPKNDKGSLRRTNMKKIEIIYLHAVSDIGSKKCYKDDSVLRMMKC